MSVLLDTHVWLWWVTGAPRLGATYRAALDRLAARELLAISAISLWEAQMLVVKERVLPVEPFERWLRRVAAPEVVRTLPLDVNVVIALNGLPVGFHGDPADRLIVATAREYGLVATRPRRSSISSWPGSIHWVFARQS